MRVLTSAEMKQAEADAVAAGTSYEQLMENAGTAAARQIQGIAAGKHLAKSILLLAGRGNNAGDAFVVARLLALDDWRVGVLPLCGDEFSPLAELNFGRLPDSVAMFEDTAQADFAVAIVCDGVFGTGFHDGLPPLVADAFATANAAPGIRIALDVPSGLDPDTGAVAKGTFKAAYTLTFGAYKPGLLPEENQHVCGEVRCLDIGL